MAILPRTRVRKDKIEVIFPYSIVTLLLCNTLSKSWVLMARSINMERLYLNFYVLP